MDNVLTRALAELERPAPELPGPPTQEPPPETHERRRGLVKLSPLTQNDEPELTIDEARAYIRAKMTEYLAMPNPTYMLLVALPPGSGKTTEAVHQAEQFAADFRGRVLYAGPRHELWGDLMRESTLPEGARDAWWYHWQPHTAGDPETGQGQTCRWARQFGEWTARGHKGFHFCQKQHVCGYNYIAKQCVYHAQKKQDQPIVFVQHMDIVLGHPFADQCHLLIGDESPLGAFLHDWKIPPHAIIPSNIFSDDEVLLDADTLELLRTIRDLVDRVPRNRDGAPLFYWHGPALLDNLGGADHVYRTCAESLLSAELFQVPRLTGGPDGVDHVPYAHLWPLLIRLRDEAAEACAGRDYITRVRVDRSGLRLLLRRTPDKLPQHIIWLDATANIELYRVMFDRDVVAVAPRVRMAGRVFQVYASLNNRDAVLGDDIAPEDKRRGKNRSGKRADIGRQVSQIVRSRGYRQTAIITYKDLKALFQNHDTAHFYNLRGSNAFTQHDAVIVVGTPQPTIDNLIDQGAMLLQERMRPFTRTWSDKVERYGHLSYGYPASGFHHDPDLQALLFQSREAELIQAAHRVRPLYRPIDVWLLTNLPIGDLPPDELLSLNDLFDAPPGVDYDRWPEVEELASRGVVTASDLMRELHLTERTARRWIDAAAKHPGWRVVSQPSSGGRPTRGIVRTFVADFRPRVY